MTEKACAEKEDKKGKRSNTVVFKEDQESFLRTTNSYITRDSWDYKDPYKREALWNNFCAENDMDSVQIITRLPTR